jgi:hypothetical protein
MVPNMHEGVLISLWLYKENSGIEEKCVYIFRAIAQAVCRRLSTAAARVQTRI